MPLTLYRRGKVWHYRGTAAGRRLRGTTSTTEKALAQRIAHEAESQAWQSRLDGPGAHVTFAQCAIAYREAGKPERFLEKIEDHWGDSPIRDITAGAVRQASVKTYPEAKAATRNRQFIKPTVAIINFAADLGWCAPLKVKRFKEATNPKLPATAQWVSSFAGHASPHLGALAFFMFGTGARITEALGLLWGDVDLAGGKAVIRQTKIEDTRHPHLPPPVVAALANIPSNREPSERVFRYTRRDSVYDAWDAAIRRANIQRLTPHCCRHGFATTMLHKGIDAKTVAERGGWKDATTVLRTYAHARTDPTITEALFDTPETQRADDHAVTTENERKNSA